MDPPATHLAPPRHLGPGPAPAETARAVSLAETGPNAGGRTKRRRRGVVACLAAAAVVAALPGCVRRRFEVRSQPPGALVYIDDQQVGRTPCAVSFTYYGTRKFQLLRDGYETLTVYENVKPPWYEVPPVDFVSENFYPGELRDTRVFDFTLEPLRVVPEATLIEQAEQLRREAQVAIPTPGT